MYTMILLRPKQYGNGVIFIIEIRHKRRVSCAQGVAGQRIRNVYCTCDNDFSYVYDGGKKGTQVCLRWSYLRRGRSRGVTCVPTTVTCEIYVRDAAQRAHYLYNICVRRVACTPTARFRLSHVSCAYSETYSQIKCYKTKILGRDVKCRRFSFGRYASQYRGATNVPRHFHRQPRAPCK